MVKPLAVLNLLGFNRNTLHQPHKIYFPLFADLCNLLFSFIVPAP